MNKINIWFETVNHEKKKNIAIAGCIFLISVIWGYINHMINPFGHILGFDFDTSVIPGWNTTIFPITFTIEWLFSSLLSIEIILVLVVILFKKIKIINVATIEILNIILLILGLISGASYFFELVISWYSGYIYEQIAFYNRVFGFYYWMYFFTLLINIVFPFLFCFKKIRKSIWATLIICVLLKFSSLIPSYQYIASKLNQDYLPSSWSYEPDFNYKFLLLLIPMAFLIRLIFIISKK